MKSSVDRSRVRKWRAARPNQQHHLTRSVYYSMSDTQSPTSETTSPVGAHDAPDSLDAAASSFQSLLFPQGAKRKPGEVSQPESEDAEGEQPEAEQPEVDETEDLEESETEEATETDEDGETSEEVESEDAQAEETETEEPTTTEPKRSRRLKFSDGTEGDVSEDEAYQGFLRTKDYTHKTQQAAEARKQADAAAAEARANAARHAEELANVKAAMDRLVPKEPNWTELRKTLSAEEYANMRDEWTAFKAERDRIEAAEAKVAEERAKDYDENFTKWRKSEAEKLRLAIPEWVDLDRGAREVGEMAQFMADSGWQQEEIARTGDSRFLLVLRKAMLWDKAQKAGKTKVDPKVNTTGKIKSAPPGGKTTPPKPKSEEQRARESLRKSGDRKSAESVFSHLLKRGTKSRP